MTEGVVLATAIQEPQPKKRKPYRAVSVFSNKRGKNSHEHLNVVDVEKMSLRRC